MGCGQSKNQVGIVPGGNAPTPRPPVKVERPNSKTIRVKATDSTDTSKVTVSDPNTPSRSIKPKKLLAKRDTWTGSQDSLGGGFKDNGRGGSASSKFSSHSQDSGFDCGEELSSHIITEDSDIDKIRQVEEAWQSPRDLGKHPTSLTDGLAQDCGNSSALALELPQYCAKPPICTVSYH